MVTGGTSLHAVGAVLTRTHVTPTAVLIEGPSSEGPFPRGKAWGIDTCKVSQLVGGRAGTGTQSQ